MPAPRPLEQPPRLVGDADDGDEPFEEMTVEEGIRVIRVERVDPLLQYLKDGQFRNKSNLSFVKAYTVVTEKGNEEPEAQKMFDFFSQVVTQVCGEAAAAISGLAGGELLATAGRYWTNFTVLVYWLQRVFQYLDRFFLAAGTGRRPLFTSALAIHAEHFYSRCREGLVACVLDAIDQDRRRQPVDEEALARVVELLRATGSERPRVELMRDGSQRLSWTYQAVGCYRQDLEAAFLAATADFYRRWAAELLARSSCSEAIREVSRALAEEQARVRRFLDASTAEPLKKACVKLLVSDLAKDLAEMQTGCRHMVDNEMKAELREAFLLLREDPRTLRLLAEPLGRHLERRGGALLDDPRLGEDPARLVAELLALKRQADDQVRGCFDNEPVFQKARNRALEAVLNKDARAAKYLALHCDAELRKGAQAKGDDELLAAADAVVGLLAHLKDKDVFLDFYRRGLSKRLLSKASASDVAEEAFLGRLKVEVGQQAVQKLQCMLTDVQLSGDAQREFRQLAHSGLPGGLELETLVLRTNAWPVERPERPPAPCQVMRDCIDAFERFYSMKHVGRKLSWLYSAGFCEVAATCFQAKHTLVVSPYQCLVLMLFNTHGELTFRQVLELTNMAEEEGRRQVQSMTVGKQQLLALRGGSLLEAAAVLSVNSDFASDRLRVVIHMVKDKEKTVVQPEEPEETAAERKHVVDAAIVRVMKARKALDHNSLVEEVVKLCSLFKPQPMQIKLQVDHLIEREFLKRDPDKANAYLYIP